MTHYDALAVALDVLYSGQPLRPALRKHAFECEVCGAEVKIDLCDDETPEAAVADYYETNGVKHCGEGTDCYYECLDADDYESTKADL